MAQQIDPRLVSQAKTIMARWVDSSSEPPEVRRGVISGVDAIARELPNRDEWFEVMTVALDGCQGVQLEVSAPSYRIFTLHGGLAVSTIVPSWGVGWSKVISDERVYDTLTWLLHYARQYVHRSYVAGALMTIWDASGRALHPFGSGLMYQRYGAVRPAIDRKCAFDEAQRLATEQWGKASKVADCGDASSSWALRNTLDPLLHQAICYFLRAQSLRSHGYSTEAVLAFDCVVQSICTFLHLRLKQVKFPTRVEACRQLGLSIEAERWADYAYFVRNNFGAHAGGWRWWDQDEMLDDAEEGIAESSRLVLEAAADLEPSCRYLEPRPVVWSEWLFENFEAIYSSVWFERELKWKSEAN